MDSFLNAFATSAIWAFIVLVLATSLLMLFDKNYAIAAWFTEGALYIIVATWGKKLAISFYLRVNGKADISGQFSSADQDPFAGLTAIAGIVACGIFASLMMILRHSYELQKLKLQHGSGALPPAPPTTHAAPGGPSPSG
ncbi:hypothetical protein [Microvirga vignae]|uniref:hypothetical protein n=1 Tax=Microvirga vignae TaxID=1225564 RepID=UPI001237871D|nr:hypothetical protein [Microvirga vignae]